MPTVSETNRTPIAQDTRGERTAQREFYVGGAVPSAVPRDGSLAGLPGLGDVYPGEAGLIADQIQVSQWGDSIADSRATVLYSTSRRFASRPEVDQTAPAFDKSTTTRIQNVEVELPVLYERNVEVGEPPSVISKTLYQLESVRVVEPRLVIQSTVTLATYNSTTALSILNETNKIHELFSGRFFLFMGATAQQVGPIDWRVTYQWESDDGTVYPTPGDGAGWLIPPTNDPTPPYRKPHNYLIYPAPPDAETISLAVNVPKYVTNATGWTTLPGSPLT